MDEISRLAYKFFDDSYTLRINGYNGEDKMSIRQFIVMGCVFILIILISILLRRSKKEKLFLIYKILAIAMPILDIVKIIFSSYYDILNNEGFNWGGILPFYTCSMLVYFLPVVAWGKGKMQRYSMAFFSTIGLVAGLSNFIYLSAAGWYPLFTFGCMYSIIYHAVIVFVGISLMITETYTPSIKTFYEGMIPVLIFSIFVIPINYIIYHFTDNKYVDYMLLMNGNGFPIIGDFAEMLAKEGLRIIFSLLMLLVAYPIATFLITLVDVGVTKAVKAFKPKENIEEAN